MNVHFDTVTGKLYEVMTHEGGGIRVLSVCIHIMGACWADRPGTLHMSGLSC